MFEKRIVHIEYMILIFQIEVSVYYASIYIQSPTLLSLDSISMDAAR